MIGEFSGPTQRCHVHEQNYLELFPIRTPGRDPTSRPIPSAKIAMPLSMNRSPRGCGSLLRFFSLFRCVAADDRFHGLHLPPHAGRQIDAESFRQHRQCVVVKTDWPAHAGHAELGCARLEQFPCGGVPRHEIGTTPFAVLTDQRTRILASGLPAGGAVFRTLTGKPLPDRR